MRALIRPLQLRSTTAADSARKVTWLELFFDLIFVAAVSQVAQPLSHDYTPASVLRFAALFVLIWWAWIGNSVFATRFDTDDALQRALTLLQIFAIAVMAANATQALESRDAAGFAAAYAAVRFVLVAQYARARQLQQARGLATRYLVGHGIAAGLWLVSALTPAPLRFAIWAAALAIDLGTPWMAVKHSAEVPPDGAHLPERFGLFTLILLGESVIAVMHGIESQERWSVTAAATAFGGMALIFAMWWWYFEGINSAEERHVRTRSDAVRFHVWSYAHLPFYLGIVIAAVGVEQLVRLDGHGSEPFQGARLLAGALAAVVAAMFVIGATTPRHRPLLGAQ